jgi:uncharacterized Tic20 family protein
MTDPTAVSRLQEHHEGWAPDQPLPAEPAVMTAEIGQSGPGQSPPATSSLVKNDDETSGHDAAWAIAGYLGAIVFWLVAPLAVYLIRGRRSPFVRRHAAQAFSLTLTVTLFAISGAIVAGLLSLDSVDDALYLMGPVGSVFVLVVLWYLVRAVSAAGQGRFYLVPSWLCVRTLRP